MGTTSKVISVTLCLLCFTTGCSTLRTATDDRAYGGQAKPLTYDPNDSRSDAWTGALIEDEDC